MNGPFLQFLEGSYSPVPVPPFPWRIYPEVPLFFAGSCFAANLASYWEDRFLPVVTSPFGNIYNPESMRETIGFLVSDKEIREDELFSYRGLWRHSLFDTAKTSPEKKDLLNLLNHMLRDQRKNLKTCGFAVLTLGTSWVYRESGTARTVNNCHKRSKSDFQRLCLTSQEISDALDSIRTDLCTYVPGIRIITSLSPVRHLRDEAVENSLSKALLRCALEELCREREECLYFPSYEIMMDELRDYRWYAEDLTHPSEAAASYIMERFCTAAGSDKLAAYIKEAEKLKKMRDHRIQFPSSPDGIKFREKREKAENRFRELYPFTSLTEGDPGT